MPSIVISDAAPEQREACYRLACEIFCGEMGTMRDVADHDHVVLRDEAVEQAHVFHAEVDRMFDLVKGIGRRRRATPA